MPASKKNMASISVKLSMVVGMIVSYIVGSVVSTKLYGEQRARTEEAWIPRLLPRNSRVE